MRSPRPGPRILGAGIGVVFAVPLVMMLGALPKFLARRYVVLDPAGLHIRHGRADDVKGMVKDYTVDKVSDALQVQRGTPHRPGDRPWSGG